MTVLLPRPRHSGGALVVRHKDTERTIQTAPSSSKNSCLWAAWYADVEHEVLPLQSGARVALLFNLFRPPSSYRPGLTAQGTVFAASPKHPIIAALLRLRDCDNADYTGDSHVRYRLPVKSCCSQQ